MKIKPDNFTRFLFNAHDVRQHTRRHPPLPPWGDDPPIYTDGVHLCCEDEAKLHRFAGELELRPEWYQDDHYAMTTTRARGRALGLGAVPMVWHRFAAKFRVKGVGEE